MTIIMFLTLFLNLPQYCCLSTQPQSKPYTYVFLYKFLILLLISSHLKVLRRRVV